MDTSHDFASMSEKMPSIHPQSHIRLPLLCALPQYVFLQNVSFLPSFQAFKLVVKPIVTLIVVFSWCLAS